MSKQVILILLILLFSSLINGVEIKPKGETVSSDNISADTVLAKADMTFQSREYQTALEQYKDAFEQSKKEYNFSVEVEALAQIARMNLILGNKEEGKTWLDKTRAIASESDPIGWSRYLGVKGRFEWKDNDLKKAQKTFDEMYTYCHVNALRGRAIDAANMIAIVADSPEEQIQWYQRGIEAAEAAEEERWLGPLWNNLAGTYYDLKQFDSALECYQKAREFHWRQSGEIAKLFADYHVGMTYRTLGDFKNAGKWLRPVLAWAERIENHSAIGQACEDLGEMEITQGNKEAGLKYLKRARNEYKSAGFDKTWQEIWENINKRIKELEG